MRFKILKISTFLLLVISHSASANLLIPELKDAQEAFKNTKNPCVGVINHVQPLAAQGHPQALIALGDLYQECSKESETEKFKKLFEIYGNAAIRDSLSSPQSFVGANKKTSGRSWGYHRLWRTMYYGNEVSGYRPENYVREIHILAAAALFHGGQDLCWRAGGPWLESRGGCDAITQLSNDYVYPQGENGWKSPFKNKPLKGVMLQIHLANELNSDDESKWVFDFAEKALAKNEKFEGKVVCINKANFSGGIQALRQNLFKSPYYGHCRNQEWSASGKTLKVVSFNDYGLIVQLSSGGWGLISLERLPRLAFDAANELGVDIRDIEKMDAFVNNLHTKVFKTVK
jgi:hypothetical protein